MFLRRSWLIRSPLGLLVTAGAVTLAVSPTARKKARDWMFKGVSAVLEFTDQWQKKEAPLKPKMEKDEYDFDFRKWEEMIDPIKAAGMKEENPIHGTNADMYTEKTTGTGPVEMRSETKPLTADLKAPGRQTPRRNTRQKTEQGNTLGSEPSSSNHHP
jgi:hypothetical protein